MLPKVNGYELLDFIKPMGIPVIFITAKGSMEDKVRGLRLGADDYLVKPFEIVELLARVEAVLRRAGKTQYEIEAGGLTIDTRSHTVMRGSRPIQLTAKEFELLLLFIQNKNIALFRETIYERIWGRRVHGRQPHRGPPCGSAFARSCTGRTKIKTIYKVGYRLEI